MCLMVNLGRDYGKIHDLKVNGYETILDSV